MGQHAKLDMAQFERELADLTTQIEQYLMYNRGATVMEVMGEFDIVYEEFLAASTYHQRKADAVRRYMAIRAAQDAQRAQEGEKGPQ